MFRNGLISIVLMSLVFVTSLFATEGNYADGFYIKGLLMTYYQTCQCEPPFGCICDSLMDRPYNASIMYLNPLMIYPEIYSKISTINGTLMEDASLMISVNPFTCGVSSDGTYKIWVDVSYYYTLQHNPNARVTNVSCLDGGLTNKGFSKFDVTKNSIDDIRILAITIDFQDIKIDKYVSQLKVNGVYSDIVITTYVLKRWSNNIPLVSCSDLLPMGPPSNVINPIVHTYNQINTNYDNRNYMLNGKIINKTKYLTNWNRVVSTKMP